MHVRQLYEVLDLLNVALEVFLAFPPKVIKESQIWRGLPKFLRNSLNDLFLSSNRLIAESLLEELIEVEVVLTEELHSARRELLDALLDETLGGGPNVEVEWPHNVSAAGLVPVEGAKSELESMVVAASVLYLLILGLDGLVVVRSVCETNAQARKLGVVRYEVRFPDSLQN